VPVVAALPVAVAAVKDSQHFRGAEKEQWQIWSPPFFATVVTNVEGGRAVHHQLQAASSEQAAPLQLSAEFGGISPKITDSVCELLEETPRWDGGVFVCPLLLRPPGPAAPGGRARPAQPGCGWGARGPVPRSLARWASPTLVGARVLPPLVCKLALPELG